MQIDVENVAASNVRSAIRHYRVIAFEPVRNSLMCLVLKMTIRSINLP
jgi:hypothetical protein